jgi:hypothetical protein
MSAAIHAAAGGFEIVYAKTYPELLKHPRVVGGILTVIAALLATNAISFKEFLSNNTFYFGGVHVHDPDRDPDPDNDRIIPDPRKDEPAKPSEPRRDNPAENRDDVAQQSNPPAPRDQNRTQALTAPVERTTALQPRSIPATPLLAFATPALPAAKPVQVPARRAQVLPQPLQTPAKQSHSERSATQQTWGYVEIGLHNPRMLPSPRVIDWNSKPHPKPLTQR